MLKQDRLSVLYEFADISDISEIQYNKKEYINASISNAFLEYEELENDLEYAYYTEADTSDKKNIFQRMIDAIKKIIEKIKKTFHAIFKKREEEVKPEEEVEVDKTGLDKIKDFFNVVKKFFASPLNFAKNHKVGTAIALTITGGLGAVTLLRKKSAKDKGYRIKKSEALEYLNYCNNQISKAEEDIRSLEKQIQNMNKEEIDESAPRTSGKNMDAWINKLSRIRREDKGEDDDYVDKLHKINEEKDKEKLEKLKKKKEMREKDIEFYKNQKQKTQDHGSNLSWCLSLMKSALKGLQICFGALNNILINGSNSALATA